jgi:hypothetical protein
MMGCTAIGLKVLAAIDTSGKRLVNCLPLHLPPANRLSKYAYIYGKAKCYGHPSQSGNWSFDDQQPGHASRLDQRCLKEDRDLVSNSAVPRPFPCHAEDTNPNARNAQ